MKRNRKEVAIMLVDCGADIAAQNNDGKTPLHLALSEQLEVARKLIEWGADVTAKNEDGETLLHLASKLGDMKLVLLLIEHGADATAKNKDGATVLNGKSLMRAWHATQIFNKKVPKRRFPSKSFLVERA
jgi:ankyrin repeat protein